MERKPLISVVVPVYGTEKYLRECLDSILNQTYENIELIVVNDASNDNSEDVINEYLQNYDNIKYVRHSKNRGLFRARISGAEEATGDYIAFVDSDDYISLDYYRLLISKALKTGADMVVANTVFHNLDNSKTIKQLYQICFTKDILEGNEIRDNFFEQQGYCFSWHTVWNKIYSIELWNKCFDHYKNMDKHLIMTEDIAFSVPLLYSAEKLTYIDTAHYFYRKTENASTSSENISFVKFCKNVGDIKTAFDFAEKFLVEKKVDEKYKAAFLKFREKYVRMWRTLQKNKFPNDLKANKLIYDLLPGYAKQQRPDEFCFDVVSADYSSGIDNIKNNILDKNVKCVSFDIFDTLICRPFYNPTDIFELMQYEFEKISNNKYNISFAKIRTLSEKYARRKLNNFEDVSLSEIYDSMKKQFNIDEDIADKMYQLENEYEIRFANERKIGKELYEFAHDVGKMIVLTSDMYLEYETIEKILAKNGYNYHETLYLSSKERALKATGLLFKRMLKGTKLKPDSVIHLGDNWNSDIVAAQKLGIRISFLPKAKEVFENVINGIKTNNCGWLDKYAAGPVVDYKAARKSISYRSMLAIVANKFFDNPYVSFNNKSDLNCNPYMIGYYAVGMHCLGIAKWLQSDVSDKGIENIYFLARDGYLPKLAFDLINNNEKIKSHYIHASRTLIMPLMINDKVDLYDLPIDFHNHSPLSVCKQLEFCSKISSDKMVEYLNKFFVVDANFKNENDFIKFIDFFADNMFDETKLKNTQQALKKYYSKIEDRSVTFDMGYSGRIQSGISKACGRPIDGYFIHSDNDNIYSEERKNGYKIQSMYDQVPSSTGIMREYLLSDISPACVKLETNGTNIVEKYDEDNVGVPEKFIIKMIQKGALDFIKDYLNLLGEYAYILPVQPKELSYPFEYLLRFSKNEDRKIFSLCRFEDSFYGNIASVSADRLFNNQICDIEQYNLPQDYIPLQKVELDIQLSDEDEQEDEDLNLEDFKNYNKGISKKVAFFYDKIDENDIEISDKFLKCANNTSNIVDWSAIKELINPVVVNNWYMTNPGGFDDGEFDVFVTSNLSWIQENTDITYLDKVLERIGDSVLLPINIGFSSTEEKKDFVLGEDSVNTLKKIAERCKSIGVKGEYTADILSKYGIKNSVIVGCPSMYKNISEMKKTSSNKMEVKNGTASFKPFYGELSDKEIDLLKFFEKNKFNLVETTTLDLSESNIKEKKIYSHLKSYENTKKIYFDIDSWRDSFEDVDFVMGMNFYNNVVALQSAVPALFVCYETTGREMCKFFNLPNIDISEFNPKKSVLDYLKYADYSSFVSSIDQKYDVFSKFLSENGVKINRVIEK